MEDPSKFIDRPDDEEQRTPDNDPGAKPSPHSLPVSGEFEKSLDQLDDDENRAGETVEPGDVEDA